MSGVFVSLADGAVSLCLRLLAPRASHNIARLADHMASTDPPVLTHFCLFIWTLTYMILGTLLYEIRSEIELACQPYSLYVNLNCRAVVTMCTTCLSTQ
jgi:hypothetical protein